MNKETRTMYMLSTRDPPRNERYTQSKSKGMEKILHVNGKGKKKLG